VEDEFYELRLNGVLRSSHWTMFGGIMRKGCNIR
jgi:hypothetical protein